ncbi:SPW repeat protein [Nocardia sp. NPDC052566]|uniref:SPW repeat domain-containing protein n=1 Tax=Nocardia sp. NPDC052566 TaxID=3364330 RepID=UPI0037CB748D
MFTDSRAQHLVVTVLGIFTALSPIWVTHNDKTMWTLVVLGVLIALAGLVQLSRSLGATADYAIGVLGALLFISPWGMDFADTYRSASWTAWVVGVVTVVAALASLPMVSGRLDKMVPHH